MSDSEEIIRLKEIIIELQFRINQLEEELEKFHGFDYCYNCGQLRACWMCRCDDGGP